jgi:hypothetical protein
MSNVTFTPGKFEPVIEVAQKATPLPIGFHVDYSGLKDVTIQTVQVTSAAARGSGSNLNEVTPVQVIGEIVKALLTARIAAEVLRIHGIHTKFTSALCNASLSILEPIVKAYNYYGTFERDGKLYSPRDAAKSLISSLITLRHLVTPAKVDCIANTVNGTVAQFNAINFDYFDIDDSGQIVFNLDEPTNEHALTILADICAQNIDADLRLILAREATQLSTKASVTAFRRFAGTLGYVVPQPAQLAVPPAAFGPALNAVIGQNIQLNPGNAIPNAVILSAISRGYAFLRRITTERSHVMKTLGIPKYEGGSVAQLASYHDDVLFSDTPLSLSDATGALVLGFNKSTTRHFVSAPGVDRDETLRDLISKSLIKN